MQVQRKVRQKNRIQSNMAKDNTKGFQTLVNDIKAGGITPFGYSIHDASGSLSIVNQRNDKYLGQASARGLYF